MTADAVGFRSGGLQIGNSLSDDLWDDYVTRHPGFTLYHGSAFHRAVARAFRMPSHGLMARNAEGRVVGVMPLVRQKSWLFGDRLVSLPYANHGGPLADTPQVAADLLQAAAAHARSIGCAALEVRDHGAHAVDWPMHTDKVLMTRPLPSSPEDLGKELGAKLRSQCRRALKEGATVSHGGAELIPAFYRVFAANMRDLGTPVYPRRWFDVLAATFGSSMLVTVVDLGGRPVAAAVQLRWRDTTEIPWAAADRDYNRFAVNMLLYREVVDHAIRSGCTNLDFGRSTRGAGTWQFKRQWGAEERPIYWRVYPRMTKPGKASAWLSEVWMRLPLPLANTLGPMVSPGLPW